MRLPSVSPTRKLQAAIVGGAVALTLLGALHNTTTHAQTLPAPYALPGNCDQQVITQGLPSGAIAAIADAGGIVQVEADEERPGNYYYTTAYLYGLQEDDPRWVDNAAMFSFKVRCVTPPHTVQTYLPLISK